MSSPILNSASLRYRTFCSTNNDLPSPGDLDRYDLADHIPDHHNTMSPSNDVTDTKLKCCCGRADCAYLEHNNTAVNDIERKLERAAQLGQALLSRHESFVSESQQRHARLDAKIAQLDAERNTLQTANERIVAENKELLSKLETLNESYKVSDNTVKTLEALLRDTEIEVRRLNGLARRAEELDARVQEMDRQRMELMRKVTDGETESRSTLARWRESERKVKQLELEVQKIEWEAKLERDKHQEVVARLERERVLERELGGAEGRLKGAAALQGIESGSGGNVVSHFVRDILQDNANLQAGIVELRELLQSSNDEVQYLRQQVIHHQPIAEEEDNDHFSQSVPLDQEVQWDEPSPLPQREVHVHHHYHTKLGHKQNRTPTIRRPSRRRTVMGAGAFSSPGSSTPSTPTTRAPYASNPIVPLHLNQSQQVRNRWSTQSSTTMTSTISSLPSSPRSYVFDRNASIFDRIDPAEDSSRPTSPESAAGYMSPPTSKPMTDGFETVLEDDDEIFSSPSKENVPPAPKHMTSKQPLPSQDLTPKASQTLAPCNPIDIQPPEPRPPDPATPVVDVNKEPITPPTVSLVDEPKHFQPQTTNISPPSPPIEDLASEQPEVPAISGVEIRPSLIRSASHDSLVSISGMDIHLAKKPPAVTAESARIRGNASYFPLKPSSARTVTATQPVASITGISAVSSKRSFSSDSQGPAGRSLQTLAGVPVTSQQNNSGGSSAGVAAGLGKIVGLGGWVGRKWGVAPTKSIADLRSHLNTNTPSRSKTGIAHAQSTPPNSIQRPSFVSTGSASGSDGMGSLSRTPGINQKGSIPGIWLKQESERYDVKVQAESVDEEGLREVLAEQ